MVALTGGEDGRQPSSPSTCAEDDCVRPRWASEKHGKRVVHSVYCYEHANVPLVDVPAEPKVKAQSWPRYDGLSTFHSEVRRQREQRERNG